jgi:hypothetical protein
LLQTAPSSKRLRIARNHVILLLLTTLAFALRVSGVQYGLPHVYNPDEVAIMARALTFAKGSLDPQNFLYPTFFFYLLFAWVGIYLAFVWVTGRVASLGELQRLYFSDPTGIYTAGRMLGVVSGAAAVVLLYRLAARLTDARTALAAAVFIAVAPLHVRDSHYVKHDVFATLTVVLAYLAIARVWLPASGTAARRKDVIAAGAACGLAFSTHYYCVFLGFPLAWAVAQDSRRAGTGQAARNMAWAAGAMLAVFLLLSPFLALHPATAVRDIVANRAIVVDRAVDSGAFAHALRYLEILISDAMGAPVVLLGAAGAVWMMATAPARAVLLLAFPLPFFAFIANTMPASRYLNPILPFVAIFAAWTLSRLATRFRTPAPALWITVALCAWPGLRDSVRSDLFFRQADTRTIALDYIQRHIPAGATVAIQPYSAPLTPSREGLVEALTRNVGSAEQASTKFRLQLAQDPYPAPAYRLIFLGDGLDAEKIYVDYPDLQQGLDALRRWRVAYVVVKPHNIADPQVAAFYSALVREGRRIATFSPFRGDGAGLGMEPFLHNTDTPIHAGLVRPGPLLEIWRLDGSEERAR